LGQALASLRAGERTKARVRGISAAIDHCFQDPPIRVVGAPQRADATRLSG
jgi:hypothetical protein